MRFDGAPNCADGAPAEAALRAERPFSGTGLAQNLRPRTRVSGGRALNRMQLLSVALLCVGCAGGQTGEETGLFCEESASTALALDEVSKLGFSASDILAFSAGEHAAEIQFSDSTEFPYDQAGTTDEVVVRVNALGGARLVERRWSGGEVTNDFCQDGLELDVRVEIATGSGSFDESFETTLTSESPNLAAFSHELDLEKLSGSFHFQPQAFEKYRLIRFITTSRFTKQGMSGSFEAHFEQSTGSGPDSNVSLTQFPIAHWASE